MSAYSFDVDDGRLLIHALDAESGFWLHHILSKISESGHDARVQTEDGRATIMVPLVKQQPTDGKVNG